jgi:multimeric flavodoxin WrbA
MKVLALIAGPRKKQVTDRIADAALSGARARGAQTEKIYLYDLNIEPCRGCMYCRQEKKCIIEDDQRIVLEKMDKADLVIFASPTYISNVTSVAKKFMDRSLPFFSATKFGPKRLAGNPSKVILITSCGAPWPFSFLLGHSGGAQRAMKAFFKHMPVKIKSISATGMTNFNKNKCAKFLKRAYFLGKNI